MYFKIAFLFYSDSAQILNTQYPKLKIWSVTFAIRYDLNMKCPPTDSFIGGLVSS
jgi:hypothetical protein